MRPQSVTFLMPGFYGWTLGSDQGAGPLSDPRADAVVSVALSDPSSGDPGQYLSSLHVFSNCVLSDSIASSALYLWPWYSYSVLALGKCEEFEFFLVIFQSLLRWWRGTWSWCTKLPWAEASQGEARYSLGPAQDWRCRTPPPPPCALPLSPPHPWLRECCTMYRFLLYLFRCLFWCFLDVVTSLLAWPNAYKELKVTMSNLWPLEGELVYQNLIRTYQDVKSKEASAAQRALHLLKSVVIDIT